MEVEVLGEATNNIFFIMPFDCNKGVKVW